MTESLERWRPFPEIGAYQVSDLGRIRRVLTNFGRHKRVPVIVKPKIDREGYAVAELAFMGRRHWRRLARAVLEAFEGPPPSSEHHAAHNNGDNSDNRLTNLRWATPLENSDDQRKHGTMVRGERCWQAKLDDARVRHIRQLHSDGSGPKRISELTGTPKSTVEKVVARKTWRHVA